MARPLKIDTEKRDRVVSFRLTGGEHAAIAAKAGLAGLEPGEFARAAALGLRVQQRQGKAAPVIPFAIADQLRRVGVNLNQLTRITYLGHDRTDEIGAAAHEVRQILAELRALLDRAHGAD